MKYNKKTKFTNAKLKIRVSILFFFLGFNALAQIYGDRNIDNNVIFPSACLIQNGGRVYDITNAPGTNLSAIGDGVYDDTEAFIDAMDYLANAYVNGDGWNNQVVYSIYIPNGTYLVSDMITYRNPALIWDKWEPCNIRFIGQSRQGVEIRLNDNCAGFGNEFSPKPIISINHPDADFNNGVGFNIIHNMTISAGSGNPGAIAVQFISANSGSIKNVTITSTDEGGTYGIYMPYGSQHNYCRDITIENYKVAISVGEVKENDIYNAFEYLTLRNQRKHAIEVFAGGFYLRKLLSDQSTFQKETIKLLDDEAQLAIYQSYFDGGGANAAITHSQDIRQMTLIRNSNFTGYTKALDLYNSTEDLEAGLISGYVSDTIFALRPGQERVPKALIEVEESPIIPWDTDTANWVVVEDFGTVADGSTDDYDAIQAALNSGKSTVFFTKQEYKIGSTLKIPASVKQIHFMRCNFNYGAKFSIEETSADILYLNGIRGKQTILSRNASRPLVIHEGSTDINTSTSIAGPQKMFLENCTGTGSEDFFCATNQTVWARGLNNEAAPANKLQDFYCNGGKLWIFGFKTENKPVSPLHVTNGGTLEALGGISYLMEADITEEPMIKNNNSSASVTMATQFRGSFTTSVNEMVGSNVYTVSKDALPRSSLVTAERRFVPLYVSYANSFPTGYEIAPRFQEILIYPNPVNHKAFTICTDELVDVQLINLLGVVQADFSDIYGTRKVDVSRLNSGMYLVRMTNASNEQLVRKIYVN